MKSGNDIFVVGIGASAGGFEALELFFSNMPADSGAAFVVVQHLSPDYKSLMSELLSKYTRMRVYNAEDGITAEKNCIYLIPPRKNMTISGGILHLTDQEREVKVNLPINTFFNSLAKDKGMKAIGIILSGTGSDGASGMRDIKETGGMLMVQDPHTAKFDGMPRSAIDLIAIDFILPPDIMPSQIVKYIKQPYIVKHEESDIIAVKDIDNLTKILSTVRERTGVDFAYYKTSAIVRRIEKRMAINQIDDLTTYARFLNDSVKEAAILHKELLIGVTKFFRDPDVFKYLEEKIIPKLFENKKSSDQIKVWVPGCSTGEEAYSLAILLKEFMKREKMECEVKIFATDIDPKALETAASGIFPESVASDITPERLSLYFVYTDGAYKVIESIRKMIIFASQNVIKDPAFNKMDLISCRNLLIYLQPVMQKKAFANFSFALNPRGILLLGLSETVGEYASHYTMLHNKFKIYERKESYFRHSEDNSPAIQSPVKKRSLAPKIPMIFKTPAFEDIASHKLLKSFAPASAIINGRNEIMHTFGNAGDYFTFPLGKASLNIFKIAKKTISIQLKTAITEARKSREEYILDDIKVYSDNALKKIKIAAIPLSSEQPEPEFILVVIDEIYRKDLTEFEAKLGIDEAAKSRINELEKDLKETKEQLQIAIEDSETANEELQATNEELLSSNEELQSANEELQSVNEELITVNSEYQMKIDELTELTNDINNLLAGTEIGAIFLDRDLIIRKYTPSITNIIHLLDSDIGRPITHIALGFNYYNFIPDMQEALINNIKKSITAQSSRGIWYSIRILPYISAGIGINGVIVTFINITNEQKLMQLREALENKIKENAIELVETNKQLLISNRERDDIKIASDTLKIDLDRFTEINNIAKIGFWEWDLETNESVWSDEAFSIIGAPKQDVENSLEYLKNIAGERQGHIIEEAFKEAMDNFKNVDLIFNPEEISGKAENLILIRAKIYYNLLRQPVKIMGVLEKADIFHERV